MALAHLERRREHPREGKINCHCYHHDDCPCHLYSCWVKRPQLHKYKILTKVKWTSSSVYTLITHSTGTETEAQLKITKPFWQKKRRLSTPCERMYIPGLEHNQKTGRLRFHPLSPQEGTLHQPVQVTEGMKVLFPIVLLPAKQLVGSFCPKRLSTASAQRGGRKWVTWSFGAVSTWGWGERHKSYWGLQLAQPSL